MRKDPLYRKAGMSVKDAIGIALAAAGLVLSALGRSVLGQPALLYGGTLLIIGLLIVYLAKRQRPIDENLEDLNFSGDGDYLSGSHGPDLPDD
ncbi:hypothetical protein AB4Z32_23435 [Massilia sp. 2TAF26]|uniref:hypothetical protein n=1 Tax=Massilia sp. 2TAF26 TaxID=3233012 RepID=UPI003F95FA5C